MSKMESEQPNSILWKSVSLVYSLYENACFFNKKKREFTVEDIERIVDQMYNSEEGEQAIKDITQFMADNYAVKQVVQAAADAEEAKKKLLNSGT